MKMIRKKSFGMDGIQNQKYTFSDSIFFCKSVNNNDCKWNWDFDNFNN